MLTEQSVSTIFPWMCKLVSLRWKMECTELSGKGSNLQTQTVNVIEYTGVTITSLRSFSEDKDGNKEAEALFVKLAKDNGMDDTDIDTCIEEGLFEEGDYQVFLIHSED